MRYSLSVFVVGLMCGTATCHAQQRPHVDRSRAAGDLVCGPRCVQYVVQHYGGDENLTDLVREIQWPDLEAGSSFDSLKDALAKRGVIRGRFGFRCQED